jgi:thiamine transport system substrate-binding protein
MPAEGVSVKAILLLLLALGSAQAAETPLRVSAYDTLLAKGGWLADVIPLFEKRCGCKVRASSVGDGGQLVGRLKLDASRGKSSTDVVVGLDQHVWERARPWTEGWGEWRPAGFGEIAEELRVGDGFLPFDYGAFALMADGAALKKAGLVAPSRLADLLDPKFKRNIILQDPRASTPGLAWVLYVERALGDGADEFWKKFRGQWLTLAAGWDAAYGLFLKGEAPLVWSYVTSQAYHREHGDKEGRYRAVLFDEGQPIQVEGAALVKAKQRHPRAREFLEFLISAEAQRLVPLRNWMLPARRDVPLPESFRTLPKPSKLIRIDAGATEVETLLERWNRRVW